MRSGLLFGFGAYAMWGLFPAFFPLLKPAGAVEILAHRIIWSFLFLVVVVAAVRRLGDVRRLDRRTWLLLTAASALIAANWVIYVYAVNNGHVVDAALGYFINPLVSIALGLVVFRERLNRWQLSALVIAVVAVVVLTVNVGAPPVIGLGLALSFGMYGAVKKSVSTDPRVSVGIEAGLATPFALAYIGITAAAGHATFTGHGGTHVVLMILAGVLTALVTPDGGRMPGQAAIIRLDGWDWEDMAVEPMAGMVIEWPRIDRSGGWGRGGRENEGAGQQIVELDDYLTEAERSESRPDHEG